MYYIIYNVYIIILFKLNKNKWSIYLENATNTNAYAPNNRTPKCMKEN